MISRSMSSSRATAIAARLLLMLCTPGTDKLEEAKVRVVVQHLERGPERPERDVPCLVIGLGAHAVGLVALLDLRDERLDVRLVQAEDRHAVERHLVDEREEGRLDLVDVPVIVEMLRVDVGDHGDGRRELEEAPVALVRLGDKELSLPELGVRAEGVQLAADHDRGVDAAGGEHRGDHRGRRGLAVGAGDGHAVLEPHELGQHLGPGNDGDLPFPRGDHLHVVVLHRRRDHDHVRRRDVLRHGGR